MVRRMLLLSLMVVLFGAQVVAQAAPQGSAPQARPDDVNVVNTPSVNVVNTPTVQLAGTSTVQVSGTTNVRVQNDSATPVPVQDVGTPKRTPFQMTQSFGPASFVNSNVASLGLTVPSGKRFVIEHVSAQIQFDFGFPFVNPAPPTFLFSISTTVAGVSGQHFLGPLQPFNFQCPSCAVVQQGLGTVSQDIKLYSDAGPTIQV